MATTLDERGADAAPTRSFSAMATHGALDELRAGIATPGWSGRKTGDDRSQGLRNATMQRKAQYGRNDSHWRRWGKPNYFTAFIVEFDGVGIRFRIGDVSYPGMQSS